MKFRGWTSRELYKTMSLIQQGIEKGLISISEDQKTIKYIHQNKSRNYAKYSTTHFLYHN